MAGIGKSALRVAIGVGHAHALGGDPYELRKNREVVNALLTLAAERPELDLRCYTPDDGQGTFPGTPFEAANVVNGWAADGWVPDVFHEVHHQSHRDPAQRGGFVIYPDGLGLARPDGGDEVLDDTDERLVAQGAELAATLCRAIGVPVWSDGILSERHTARGRSGRRLSVFAATVGLRATTTRLITEAAHYTNPDDRAVMDGAGFAVREADGLIRMYTDLARVQSGWTGHPGAHNATAISRRRIFSRGYEVAAGTMRGLAPPGG